MKRTLLNIACGGSYVDGWDNYDYAPESDVVKKTNLLGRLPYADNTVDVIYSSHFFEHIPRNLINGFLLECFRILKPGGQIRLVLPDFEELCREYLSKRETDQHEKANLVVLEILDQCVRKVSGGELAEYYQSIISSNNKEMADYIFIRTGEQLKPVTKPSILHNIQNVLSNPIRLIGKLEQFYCLLVAQLLPSAFLRQNVSFTQVGELHTWIYDFYSLSNLLIQAGFNNIKKLNFNQTDIEDFPLFPLDVLDIGLPRKGAESMYIEASKT